MYRRSSFVRSATVGCVTCWTEPSGLYVVDIGYPDERKSSDSESGSRNVAFVTRPAES